MPETIAPDQPTTTISPEALNRLCMELGATKLALYQAQVTMAEQAKQLNALKATARVTPLREVVPAADEQPATNGRVRT